MRWIVRLFVAIVAFVGVAVVALFLLPTDRIGELASDQLKKQTGRTLTLAGDFSPTLYPTLGVKTGPITISNADWASEPVMISAKGAAVGVNLMALIGGNLQIEKLDLMSPVVYLEKAKDGRVNWDLSNGASTSTSGAPTPSNAGSQPTLELGSISNGQVLFVDRTAGSTTKVTDINGTVSLPKGKSTAALDLSATVDGLTGAIKGTILDLESIVANAPSPIDATVSFGDVTASLAGMVGLSSGIPAIDATFSANAKGLGQTAKTLGLTLPDQAKSLSDLTTTGQITLNDANLLLNGTFGADYAGQSATGTINLSGVGDWLSRPEFNTDLAMTLQNAGQIAYNGRIGLGGENMADGDFSASFSDLRRIMKLAGADPATPSGTFKTGSASGTLALTPAGKYRLRNATLKLDQNTLTGAISITPRDPRPVLLAQLNGNNLDFGAYTADGSSGGAAALNGSAPTGWSKDPISLKGLDAVDADVDLRAQSINLGVSQLGKTDVTARLRDGLMTLTMRDVRAFEGALAGKINLRGGNSVAFDTDIRADGVQLEPFLGQLIDMDRLRGSGNTTLALKGRGQSLHQIMTSLSGDGTVKFTDGAIKGIDLAGMMRNLKSAFGGFNGATEFSTLDGTFSMSEGVLQNVDLSLISPLFKAAGKGSVDIGGQAMNYVVTPTRLSKDAEFSVPVTITGPWQNLKFRPDLDKLLDLLLDQKLKDSEEAKKLKEKLDAAKAKLKNPEDELKRKLQKEVERKTTPQPTQDKSLEDQAKDKLEDEIGNALKKLFD